MIKYVCSPKEKSVWSLSPEEVKMQMFDTEAEAIEWFKNNYPSPNGEELVVGQLMSTIHFPIKSLSYQREYVVGEIIFYERNNE